MADSDSTASPAPGKPAKPYPAPAQARLGHLAPDRRSMPAPGRRYLSGYFARLTVTVRSTGVSTSWRVPSGQRISKRIGSFCAPKPKCKVRSF